MEVYHNLGPGLLEKVYEQALMCELKERGLKCQNQVECKVPYKGIQLDMELRIDILVEDCIILELKSVDTMISLYSKQLLTYMRLTNIRVGFLVNFNVEDICLGIKRIVNKFPS